MRWDLGIDLGTTSSAAAVATGNRLEVLTLGTHASAVPSAVYLRDEGPVVGEPAVGLGATHPDRLVVEFKRHFGESAPLMVGDRFVTPEELQGHLGRWIFERSRQLEGSAPTTVVLTAPAFWGAFRRDQFLEVGKTIAPACEVRLLSEPEAAAIYYATRDRVPAGAVIGVYDFGGGTFDAAVLRKTDTGFDILGRPAGDNELGGVDIDQLVFGAVLERVGIDWAGVDRADPEVAAQVVQLRRGVTQAKELLSSDLVVDIPVALARTTVRLTRRELEAMASAPVNRTMDVFDQALRYASTAATDLHAILLVGGSSQMPMVALTLQERFGAKVAFDVHAKFAVCLGAALSAHHGDRVPVLTGAPPPPPPGAAVGATPASGGGSSSLPPPSVPGGATKPSVFAGRTGRIRLAAVGGVVVASLVVAGVVIASRGGGTSSSASTTSASTPATTGPATTAVPATSAATSGAPATTAVARALLQPVGRPFTGHTDAVYAVAWSADGKELASASQDGTVRIWDVRSGQTLGQPFSGHGNFVFDVAWSPDQTRLASAGFDKTVRIWDAATRAQIGEPLVHPASVYRVAWSPDGTRVATASNDHLARIWDVRTGQQIGEPFTGHDDIIYSLMWSPDGTRLATAAGDRTVRIWDVASHGQQGEPIVVGDAADTRVFSVAWSPDGTRLATGGGDHVVRIWSVSTRQQLGDPLGGFSDSVLSVAWSPDGTKLAAGSQDRNVMIWDAASRRSLASTVATDRGGVVSVAWSPDGTELATGGEDSAVHLWTA